ncbi:DUF3307 domain-containing protein [Brevibacillus sp. RS1.1]|uniref:DUF3307 domain-containing protein n=1 Tax=Brevibacillus sp. RS1.1 TaxID=2738982 RepID=UPI00156AAB81|nr:DUF3307 domain-containing protein [Brevibacillus sp. RS1.1]NRR06245.1 DUF3307 domain-containing protein [Brevibacillus sp. RS1.1]
MLLLSLTLAHLVADFYFQTDVMVADKKKYLKRHLFHHLITISIALVFYYIWIMGLTFNTLSILNYIVYPTIVIVFFHYLIDKIKIIVNEKLNVKIKKNIEGLYKLTIFIIDQILHFVSLLLTCQFLLNIDSLKIILEILKVLHVVKGTPQDFTPIEIVLFMIIMFIIITTVSGHMIKHLIGTMPNHQFDEGKFLFSTEMNGIEDSSLTKKLKITEEISYTLVQRDQISRGTIIGYIERLLVVIFTIYGAYPAIGFIVTAKSFARFKQLDDRQWAEYFLLGTLASMCLGIIFGILIRNVLN